MAEQATELRTRRLAYLSLRRAGYSQTASMRKTGTPKASAYRYDRDAGLSSPRGVKTNRRPPKDRKLVTDDTAVLHDVRPAKVPGAGDDIGPPKDVLQPQPLAHPDDLDRDRALAIPSDLLDEVEPELDALTDFSIADAMNDFPTYPTPPRPDLDELDELIGVASGDGLGGVRLQHGGTVQMPGAGRPEPPDGSPSYAAGQMIHPFTGEPVERKPQEVDARFAPPGSGPSKADAARARRAAARDRYYVARY